MFISFTTLLVIILVSMLISMVFTIRLMRPSSY
jgi:hypothetical protein